MEHAGHHFIAIFGGAVAGSEAAHQLALRGFRVVVFDQNILPYGKIEDGLPKWHYKLRDQEEKKINDKLRHENIRFIPQAKLGLDINFLDIVNNWGFTAVLLATGAWKDRPLPIEGIDSYINKGLYYQNPFVYWYNHYHEPNFKGQQFEVKDNAIIVGGGLASMDIAKILMFEIVQKALVEKGHEVDMFMLEHGIDKVLQKFDLTLDDLDVSGCTIFYRRRAKDMPLSTMPTDTPEQLERAQMIREKILGNYQRKYLFKLEECCAPVDKIIRGEKLTGIRFQKTKIENGKVIPQPDSFVDVESSLIISSIGSIPDLVEGIPADRQVYKINKDKCCQIEGYNHVFALGNAVTGRGNIKESKEHGKKVTVNVMDKQLHWQEEDFQEWLRGKETNIEGQMLHMVDHIEMQQFMPDEVIESILTKTEALQQKVGYDGDYDKWIEKHLPIRLEDMLGK